MRRSCAGCDVSNLVEQVDPGVSAAVHYVSSLYYKAKKDFAEFYKSSLLYLAFVSSDKLEHDYKLVRHSHLTARQLLRGVIVACFERRDRVKSYKTRCLAIFASFDVLATTPMVASTVTALVAHCWSAVRSHWRWTSRWRRCWETASTASASCCCTPS